MYILYIMEGPKTAVCAGLLAWGVVLLFINIPWMIFGLLSVGFGIAVSLFQAVEFGLVGFTAGFLYKEE